LQQRAFDPTTSGIVSTLPMLISIVSSIVWGKLADATGRSKLLYVVGFAAMCVSVAMMFSGVDALLWAGIIIMGLLAMGNLGLGVAIFPTLLPSRDLVPLGMGVLIVAQCLGQFLGTALPPLFLGADVNQWPTMCAGVLALGVLGLICLLFVRFKGVKESS
jgi:MFS family permease